MKKIDFDHLILCSKNTPPPLFPSEGRAEDHSVGGGESWVLFDFLDLSGSGVIQESVASYFKGRPLTFPSLKFLC